MAPAEHAALDDPSHVMGRRGEHEVAGAQLLDGTLAARGVHQSAGGESARRSHLNCRRLRGTQQRRRDPIEILETMDFADAAGGLLGIEQPGIDIRRAGRHEKGPPPV